MRAHFEWMPIRQVDMDDNLRIWRDFSIGDLFDLVMLDTRQYDRSITDTYDNTDLIHAISDEQSRSVMGGRQEKWFYRKLIESQKRAARWRIVGNQIVFSRMNASLAVGNTNPMLYDQWDGYTANRNRTLKTIIDNKISNTVFLAGDSHASWVSDIVWLGHNASDPYNSTTGHGAVGVEFAGTAVSSPSPLGLDVTKAFATYGSQWLLSANPELQWQELYHRGYYELDINYKRIIANFFGTPDILTRNGKEFALASFEVLDGANKLSRSVGGGKAYGGALRGGKVVEAEAKIVDTNVTK